MRGDICKKVFLLKGRKRTKRRNGYAKSLNGDKICAKKIIKEELNAQEERERGKYMQKKSIMKGKYKKKQ